MKESIEEETIWALQSSSWDWPVQYVMVFTAFAQRPNKKMKEESYFLPLSENICPMSIFQRISCVITSLKDIKMCWIYASIYNIEQTHDISSIWRINVWIWLGILSACQGFVDIENTQHLWKIRGLWIYFKNIIITLLQYCYI